MGTVIEAAPFDTGFTVRINYRLHLERRRMPKDPVREVKYKVGSIYGEMTSSVDVINHKFTIS